MPRHDLATDARPDLGGDVGLCGSSRRSGDEIGLRSSDVGRPGGDRRRSAQPLGGDDADALDTTESRGRAQRQRYGDPSPVDAADARCRPQPVRGRDPTDDQPVPIDDQIDAMTGDALATRLRRAPLARRRLPPGSQTAADPIIPLALSDFHDLRRLGLFGDDGRNPPPSWWAR